jgi:hypothetical protein
MFDLSKVITELRQSMADLKTVGLHSLQANQLTARILAREYGAVDDDPLGYLTPRRLSKLPLIMEETITEPKDLDVQKANQGRPPSRGFYANMGSANFGVVLVGIDGGTSGAHTLMPGTVIPVTSLIARIIIQPAEGDQATYQVYLQ